MAYSNPGNDDVLSDTPDAPPPEDKASKSEEGSEQTALVPESLCPGMKPGDEMVVKIEEVQDGQYLVSYAPEEGGEEEKGEEPHSESGDKEMASYMS